MCSYANVMYNGGWKIMGDSQNIFKVNSRSIFKRTTKSCVSLLNVQLFSHRSVHPSSPLTHPHTQAVGQAFVLLLVFPDLGTETGRNWLHLQNFAHISRHCLFKCKGSHGFWFEMNQEQITAETGEKLAGRAQCLEWHSHRTQQKTG